MKLVKNLSDVKKRGSSASLGKNEEKGVPVMKTGNKLWMWREGGRGYCKGENVLTIDGRVKGECVVESDTQTLCWRGGGTRKPFLSRE